MSPATATPDSRKGWLDRALSLFTEVRAGESISALMALLLLLVVPAYGAFAA